MTTAAKKTARKAAPRKRVAPKPKTPAETNVLSFNTDVQRKLTADDKLTFLLDGEPYVLLRPKDYLMVSLVIFTEQITEYEDDADSSDVVNRAIASSVDLILRHVEQPGESALRRRLNDPHDDLDLENLLPIVTDLVGALSARPTGAQPESS